jgi:hypothetical protein
MHNIPTVTKLLNLLDKPPLMKWANKIGLEGVTLEEHYKKSKAKGNSYHNQVEGMIKHNKEIEDPILRGNFHAFFDDSNIIESEKDVTGEYWRGRYDVKFERNGLTYLCDFKSNAKRVYLENKLQLIAYSEIDKVDQIGIISLPDFRYFPVQIKDRKPYIGILRALSHIFQCKQLI